MCISPTVQLLNVCFINLPWLVLTFCTVSRATVASLLDFRENRKWMQATSLLIVEHHGHMICDLIG